MDPPIRDAGIKGRSSYPMGTGLGLGYSFAQELLASGGVDGPIGLVPCAYGGSPLSRWERAHGLTDEWVGNAINIVGNGDEAVDGDLYARAIRRARLALERGNTVLRGVIWHQGESDTRDLALAQSYGARLTTLISNLREDLAAPFLPFLIGELGHWLLAEPTPDGKGGMHGAHTVCAQLISLIQMIASFDTAACHRVCMCSTAPRHRDRAIEKRGPCRV
jgi:hypothetical protein